MAIIVKPTTNINIYKDKKRVFLAGSIEMGKAVHWQKEFENMLEAEDVVLFNPRRDDWNKEWLQRINNIQFRSQVQWELEALEESDLVVMYFDSNTMSPITLLELGLFARSGKLIVMCPEEFWRSGNVDIVCLKYGVKQVATLEELYKEVITLIKN